MKIHEKIRVGIPEIGTFSAVTEFKAEFWDYNEKKYGLSFGTKKVLYFRWSPGG